jgi:regulator of sigma E protease
MNELGVAFNTRGRTFTEGVDRATDQFVTSLTSFKVLFEPGGWENLGGIISVYTVSSMATDVGFYYYLYVWGYISLNLAIVNLLPFPGLDGWHLVVCAFEGITRRDMPTKVRDIMSVVGTILLFGLMIFVTVLDIIRL